METRFEGGKVRVAARTAIGQAWRALLIVAAAALATASRADMDTRTAGYDLRATATAQLLAGMTPEAGDPVVDRLAELDVWKAHRDAMQAQWAEVRRRLDAMSEWRGQELQVGDAQRRTLLYPFSGPDFLNAWTMFPDHGRYVFFSLENAGRLPDLAALSPRQFAELLDDMRSAMQDIFQRNYFITDYMSHQLTGPLLKGSVPLIAAMMALEGERIVRIDTVDLFPQLSRAYADPSAERPRKRLKGALIQFLAPGSDVTRQLYYFSLDATDKALEFYPDFLAWVGSNRPATVFLKSASYLLHDNQFSKTRDMLLRAGDLVVQDDTGIPYHSLIQGGWQIKLFGQYEKPIRQLSYGYQPDLKTAWTAGADANPLPFPFGYHWRSGQSGVMIATKNPS